MSLSSPYLYKLSNIADDWSRAIQSSIAADVKRIINEEQESKPFKHSR
jgi:hypothetical protein